ncbi:ABC-2 type transport system permease protein [Methanofollis sp. W23]|uniref:ABC transporter permease n=1 Tax=Methanofollis sp. W23 TaxID=2817849 RepID=UPI001AEACAC9|nr:ABC transporter permease subunit [Methanofollis sp. W23]MBP2146698.1 ABC-2 type transport system permease protein [Methanofollis sp. W23]
MRIHALKTIAGKEFRDHVRSRKFHLIFGIFLVIALVSLASGMAQYQEELETYNEAYGDVSDEARAQMPASMIPSPLSGFTQMAYFIGTLGAVLGCAMGFDLVTREKESKSLKLLLSHPVYRDEVINGKALGGAGAIALAMAIVLVLALAVLLVFGVVPSFEETVRVLIFGGLSFLMVFSFFILALFFSTVAKDSGSALVLTLVLFVPLSAVTILVISGPAITFLIGDPPEPPESPGFTYTFDTEAGSTGSGTTVISDKPTEVAFDQEEYQEKMEEYREESRAYWERRTAITDTFTLLSPDQNYQRLAFAVTEPGLEAARQHQGENALFDPMTEPKDGLSTFFGLLGGLSQRIIALFVFPAAFFGLAWVQFAREDIR